MLFVSAPFRKEHPSLLLERGSSGMQQCLIGQWDLWSLWVAIPTCLWFPASRGVKCRVELVPRGGPAARGNPGLCIHPAVLASWLAPLGSLTPGTPQQHSVLRCTERAAGWHGTGGSPGHLTE